MEGSFTPQFVPAAHHCGVCTVVIAFGDVVERPCGCGKRGRGDLNTSCGESQSPKGDRAPAFSRRDALSSLASSPSARLRCEISD